MAWAQPSIYIEYIDCPYIRSITVCVADNRSAEEPSKDMQTSLHSGESGKGIAARCVSKS